MKIENILQKLNINALNSMQSKTFEASKTKNNIILLSPTGSGKTLAFLISIISKLDKDIREVQSIIIVPTRELALQTEEVFKKISANYKVNVCYGGHSTKIEVNNFSTPPTVLIGTPGRIAFHIREKNFKTNNVKSYVLDEFDKALEMGFQKDMEYIINSFEKIE